MEDKPPQRSLSSRVARKTGSVAGRFFIRWALWTAVIALLSEPTAAALWPRVYAEFGPPLGLAEKSVYQAVLFGGGVASLVGGASVAFVGMLWKR